MFMPAGHLERSKRLAATQYKYSYRGRLERFCAGRIRILPIRLGYEACGGLLVAGFGSWQLGLFALASCYCGELLEYLALAYARRGDRIRQSPRWTGRVVTIGSATWAVGASGGVSALWAIGGVAAWFLGFVFLFAALVNAHLVGGLHRPSLRVKQFILLGAGIGLLSLTAFYGDWPENLGIFSIGSLVMVLTLAGLFARLDVQNRQRHLAERNQIETHLNLEALNEDLNLSKERLRAHAQSAEALAFDSQAATRAKSKFLSLMSREVSVPLNHMIVTANTLQSSELDAEQASAVGEIRRGSEALLQIVADILDLSDADAGKLKVEQNPFDFRLLWEDICNFAQAASEEKGIEFASDGAVEVGLRLIGDAARIRQILWNLLTNSIRSTKEGTVVLSLTTKRSDGEISLCIVVTDQGPGIPKNILSRLFDGLSEDGDPAAAAVAGTGLGLSVSRRLARLMGGDLRAESAVGQGSRFTLTLPLKMEIPTPKASKNSSPVSGAAPADLNLQDQLVLIVDDGSDSRNLLQSALEATGARTRCITGADPILERVYDLAPDIILFGGLDAPDAARIACMQIRDSEDAAGRERCPIIATTSSALSEDRKDLVAAGVDSVVIRPVTRARLFSALRQVKPI